MAKAFLTLYVLAALTIGAAVGYANWNSVAGGFGGALIGLIIAIGLGLSALIVTSLLSPSNKRGKEK